MTGGDGRGMRRKRYLCIVQTSNIEHSTTCPSKLPECRRIERRTREDDPTEVDRASLRDGGVDDSIWRQDSKGRKNRVREECAEGYETAPHPNIKVRC